MGKRLGITEYTNHDLGEPITAVITAATTLASIGSKQGWFGGASCSDADLQKRDQLEQAIQDLLTPSERQQLVSYAESNISPTPREMANFRVGGVNKWGADCKHKNVSSGDQQFMDQLDRLLQQKTQAKQGQQNSSVPTNMNMMTAGMSPVAKYAMIVLGVSALGGAAWYGYENFNN
jgi:hypothetical protein